MPHQCTNCGCVFGDGSKEMLSGCPECGGTTFQFRPDDVDDGDAPVAEEPPDPPEGAVGTRVGRATSIVRGLMSSGSSDPPVADEVRSERTDEGRDADVLDSTEPDPSDGPEDSAQATARSEFVSSDSLPPHTPDTPSSESSRSAPASDPPPSNGRVVREPTGEQPDLAELRAELNDQFESIKILEPGQYELNLMELYDREEYIIALQENGHYIIQMPETWLSDDG
ncbi:Zn-ribbon domain-containing protein [Halocatena salina]|uniref:Zn-ribbon domain-containing protein n=1 Tax=Halocatena salina TaxID=2934340 RepID=A0A8T9ZYT0_9EURY|nr:Zn-ribbon domain-containing protein [Halocatena salina]UPM41870.1 Zn-ribbon domain-containing protein [Halocatena salina]